MVQSVVPVCGLVSGPVETRPAPHNGLPASNAWILVASGLVFFCSPVAVSSGPILLLAVDSGFRTVCCCGAVAVLLQCCCGAVAVLLLFCGRVAVVYRGSG